MNQHVFKWTLIGMSFFSFIIIFRVILGLCNVYLETAVNSFFYFSILAFLLAVLSIYLVYKYNKIGVFLFPAVLFLEFFYYVVFGLFPYDNVVGIFWYIGFGLIPIIEKWKLFNKESL
jgi:hypothetical protein